MFNAEGEFRLQTIVPLMTVGQAPSFFPFSSIVCSQLTSTITYYNKLPYGTVLCLQSVSTLSDCTTSLRLYTPLDAVSDLPTFFPTDTQSKHVHCLLSDSTARAENSTCSLPVPARVTTPGSVLCQDSSEILYNAQHTCVEQTESALVIYDRKTCTSGAEGKSQRCRDAHFKGK